MIPGTALLAAKDAWTKELLRLGRWDTDAAMRAALEAAAPHLHKRAAPNTVATIEELDALADESVIRDAEGDVYRIATARDRGVQYKVRVWWQAGPEDEFSPVALPATVLWEPPHG